MRKALLNLGLGCFAAQSAASGGDAAADAPTEKPGVGARRRSPGRHQGPGPGSSDKSNNGLESERSSISESSKTEKAEIFLRNQQEKLLDRAKYQSVFDERVGLDYEGGCALEAGIAMLSISDDEDDSSSAAGESQGKSERPDAGDKQQQQKQKQQQQQQQQQQRQEQDELAVRFTGSGPSRTLWCNMEEVQGSGLLATMSKEDIKLQEAQFEIISTEASYYKNLVVLIDTFYKHEKLDHTNPQALIKALDKHHLFSNIVEIFDCSATFLKAMEDEWQKSPKVDFISQVILDHIERLKVYRDYCRNFFYQTKTLQKLCSNPQFQSLLLQLQQSPGCRSISLQSYLEMPMKRIMSLQLLMDAVIRRIREDNPVYTTALRALGELLNLAKECDQESKMMSEKEQMLKLQNQLSFVKVKKVGCWGSGRHLLKEGQLRVINASPNTQRFVAKMSFKKTYLQLHAFSDLLIVSKPKGDDEYQVLKHCPRAFVDAELVPAAAAAGAAAGT